LDNTPERETRILWEYSEGPEKNETTSRSLWEQNRESGIIPVIGKAMAQPKKPITIKEFGVIEKAFERFQYGVRMFEKLIWNDYTVSGYHNRIHRYLMARGLAKAKTSKSENGDRGSGTSGNTACHPAISTGMKSRPWTQDLCNPG